jgi:hypothetical protein
LIGEKEDDMKKTKCVTAGQLGLVLENLEWRIRILKEVICNLDKAHEFPVKPEQSKDVKAVVELRSATDIGCRPKKWNP